MLNKLTSYLKGSYEELKKVEWPTRREALRATLVVLGVSLGLAVFLGAVDLGLNRLLQLILA